MLPQEADLRTGAGTVSSRLPEAQELVYTGLKPMPARWPHAPSYDPPMADRQPDGGSGRDFDGWCVEIPHTTSCKHGPGSCETCGTTNRRDTFHTTKGGRGVVSRLLGR